MHIKYEAKFGKKQVEGTFFASNDIVAKSSLTEVANEFIFKRYKKVADFVSTSEVK